MPYPTFVSKSLIRCPRLVLFSRLSPSPLPVSIVFYWASPPSLANVVPLAWNASFPTGNLLVIFLLPFKLYSPWLLVRSLLGDAFSKIMDHNSGCTLESPVYEVFWNKILMYRLYIRPTKTESPGKGPRYWVIGWGLFVCLLGFIQSLTGDFNE